jgi:hypothetical protein
MGMVWWHRKYAKEQSAEDQGRYVFAELDNAYRIDGFE